MVQQHAKEEGRKAVCLTLWLIILLLQAVKNKRAGQGKKGLEVEGSFVLSSDASLFFPSPAAPTAVL